MPPPGGFLRPSAAQRLTTKPKEVVQPKDDELLDDHDDKPAKKLKLVVYGDSDSDND